MIALLLNTVFFTWNVIFSLVTRAILTSIAHIIVLVIQRFKTPDEEPEESQRLVEQAAGFIKSWVMEALSTMASSGFELLVGGVTGSVTSAGSAIAELVEKMRDSLQGLLEKPEFFDGLTEMIGTMFVDFWSHFKDAVGYVMENLGS